MNLDQALDYARQVGLSDAHLAVTVRAAADEKRFAQLGDNVLMRHTNPELDGQEIAVHPDTVAQYEDAGWKRVDKLADPEPDAEPAVPADKPKTAKEK